MKAKVRYKLQSKTYVYGPNAVSAKIQQNRLKRFQSRNFHVKSAARSGRPVTDEVDAISEKEEQDLLIGSYGVADELRLKIDHTHLWPDASQQTLKEFRREVSMHPIGYIYNPLRLRLHLLISFELSLFTVSSKICMS